MRRFVTRSSRFVHGRFVHATPQEPAIITLEDGVVPDDGLEPYEGGTVQISGKPRRTIDDGPVPHPHSSPIYFEDPVAVIPKEDPTPQDAAPATPTKGKKRSSDNDVL